VRVLDPLHFKIFRFDAGFKHLSKVMFDVKEFPLIVSRILNSFDLIHLQFRVLSVGFFVIERATSQY